MTSHSPETSVLDEKPDAAVAPGVKSDAEKGVLAASTHKHHDPNWTGADVDFGRVDEARVLRKMDIRLIPVLAVLYLLSFLDRGKYIGSRIGGRQLNLLCRQHWQCEDPRPDKRPEITGQ